MVRAVHVTLKRIKKATLNQRVSSLRKAPNTSNMAAAAKVSPDKPLTDKQKAFCAAIANGNPIPTAVHIAGYNEQPSYGYRMMKMPNIKRQIAKYQQEFAVQAQLSKKDVMEMHKEAYDMAKLMSEPATMVSAAREIGKMCGYYEPTKVQVDVNMHGSVKFEQLTDAQLFEMIEKAARDAEIAESQEQSLLETDVDAG